MDIQVCRMRAESYGYNLNDVVFAWTIDKQIDMAENLTLPQFSIMGHRHISCTKVSCDKKTETGPCRTPFQQYTSGNYTCIEAQFILKREIGYYLIQIYIPSLLIVVLR